ncbi:MAG: V-type ATP synthase subunit F [Acholeplasma sp.]|nr:V-type ATP synthase subunit F [Acholeplasma sp.]
MANKSIIAFGHDESVYLFNAIGVDGVIATVDNFEELIAKHLEKGDKKIFLVSQRFNELVLKIKEQYINDVYPIFLVLAMDNDEKSMGEENIRDSVEKATGINLF